MLRNYFCAQMSNFKRLRLLYHTLRQGYDVIPVKNICTKQRAAFTVLAMNESLQLRQKNFIMRLVVFLKKLMVSAEVLMHGKQTSSSLILRKQKSMESITSGCSAISSFPNIVDYPGDNNLSTRQCSFTSLQIGSAISSKTP